MYIAWSAGARELSAYIIRILMISLVTVEVVVVVVANVTVDELNVCCTEYCTEHRTEHCTHNCTSASSILCGRKAKTGK